MDFSTKTRYYRITGTINYDLFKIYSETLILWLNSIVNPLNRRKSTPQKTSVIYGNPERVYSRLNFVLSNERINVPVISVYLTGLTPKSEYNIPTNLRFIKTELMPSGRPNLNRTYEFSKPKTFSLDYEISIWTEFKSDIDYFLFTILSEFNNGETKYHIISDKNNLGIQFVPIKLKQAQDNSELNVGNAKDLFIKSNISVEIPNAYLPTIPTESLKYGQGLITDINLFLENQLTGENLE